ncbi:MAG: hypothetical protein ACE5IH_08830, partial [Thermodesulfobacteriota bacterium]
EGKETFLVNVSRGIGFSSDYTRIVCESLGRRDFIDVLLSGKVTLKPKGWAALKKTPFGKSGDTPPMSREEKYKRWTV